MSYDPTSGEAAALLDLHAPTLPQPRCFSCGDTPARLWPTQGGALVWFCAGCEPFIGEPVATSHR